MSLMSLPKPRRPKAIKPAPSLQAPPPPPPPPVVLEAVPAAPPAPPASPAPLPVLPSLLLEAMALYVEGMAQPEADPASGQSLRRWPSLAELSGRLSIPMAALQDRALIDGWEGRRGMFQADLERSRHKMIAERIALQEMPARLAYLGVHNDLVRCIGRVASNLVPKDDKAIPDIDQVTKTLNATLKAGDVMAMSQGRTKESVSPFSLAVQVANSQNLGVPIPMLPPGTQVAMQEQRTSREAPVGQKSSLWQILVTARQFTAEDQAKAAPAPGSDPYDRPSPLSNRLASDRIPA
jgi:hypothetical protein